MKFNKLIILLIGSLYILISSTTISQASSHPTWQEIKKIKKEITALGEEPIKRKAFQGDKKWLNILENQLDQLKKEKEQLDAAKEEIIKEIEALGGKPKTDTSLVDNNEEIIALKKQLDELKAEKEKEKNDAKKKEEEKKQAAAKEKQRDEVIQLIKKEIVFMGETPISEFELNNDDKYLAALNKQLDEIKALKEEEEKEIQQSIPGWFIKMPRGTEKVMYVRGTAVVDTLQGSIDAATNAALRELGKKLETRLNSKVDETVRQAGMGENIATKSEMNRVSSLVVKEVTIIGYEVANSKMVNLDNGSYRTFILLEYPLAQVYKAFINRIERQSTLQKDLTAIKNTDAFKELEFLVSEFTGA